MRTTVLKCPYTHPKLQTNSRAVGTVRLWEAASIHVELHHCLGIQTTPFLGMIMPSTNLGKWPSPGTWCPLARTSRGCDACGNQNIAVKGGTLKPSWVEFRIWPKVVLREEKTRPSSLLMRASLLQISHLFHSLYFKCVFVQKEIVHEQDAWLDANQGSRPTIHMVT